MELYTQAFDSADALDQLEQFASFNGPDFYQLPRNVDTITLRREEWTMPVELAVGDTTVVPLNAGEKLHWKLE
jgi:dihydroorotase